MTEARDAADAFLSHYRRYARIAAKRKAGQPRNAQSGYERINRELTAAETAYAGAVAELRAAEDRLTELAAERERLQARHEALRESPEMRSATELERAGTAARRAAEAVQRVETERAEAEVRVRDLTGRKASAVGTLESARGELAVARQSARDCATAARIGREHDAEVDTALDVEPELARLRHAAGRLAERQLAALKHVRALRRAGEDTARNLAEARRGVAQLDAEADDLAGRRADAERSVVDQGSELVAAVRAHLDRARELRLADPAATLAGLELWIETLDGPNPAAAAVAGAGQTAADELARADAELAAEQQTQQRREAELTDEIGRLDRGEDSTPPAPHTRDHTSRADRPGAPLWQLVDFVGDVDDAARAGLEAALEAAGILDAWVTPGGELLAADTDDVVLRVGRRTQSPLSGVLVPAVDRDDPQASRVADATVAALLDSIGLGGDGDTWVTADGRFRVGVLEGAWHKPVAVYIGRGARAAARRVRIAELRRELSGVEAELVRLTDARTALHERKATLQRELALPDDAALRQAHAAVSELARERERLDARRERAAQAATAAATAAESATTALHEAAADAGLPTEPEALEDVDAALGAYRAALAGLWPAVKAVRVAQQNAEQAGNDLQGAQAALEKWSAQLTTAQHEVEAARERFDTLADTVGAAVAELQRQLAEVAEKLRRNKAGHDAAQDQANQAREARGKAEGRREALAAELAEAAEQRAAAAESFRRFAGTGLLAVALPDLEIPDPRQPWAPDPTVRLARRINDDLADLPDDDPAWDRVQRRLNDELKALQDTLSRQGNRAVADLREDGVVVEVEFRGRPASVPELTRALAAEVADREHLLNEREREILENHLVNEVASTLQELISAAEAQVAAMNAELERRPTSTGMRLRLIWRPREDGPTGLAEARRRLLRQTSDAWSEADRTAVGGFLQERISEVRSRDASGTWLEHLTEALDYRAWHRFVIERHQNGQWRSATGPASGGERVLAASVPLFAAASAHYASAGVAHAPRLVTLDEAFAGVDDNARAKYLGLLAAFDLDVVMTSEREWGCYPEVPGLAISQLSRTDGVAAVLVTNWEWDGERRSPADRAIRAVTARAAPPPREGLFG